MNKQDARELVKMARDNYHKAIRNLNAKHEEERFSDLVNFEQTQKERIAYLLRKLGCDLVKEGFVLKMEKGKELFPLKVNVTKGRYNRNDNFADEIYNSLNWEKCGALGREKKKLDEAVERDRKLYEQKCNTFKVKFEKEIDCLERDIMMDGLDEHFKARMQKLLDSLDNLKI